jgi:hypothetical protein
VWAFEQSVDCRVSRDFAWRFWTKVSNWPVEKVQDYIATVTPGLLTANICDRNSWVRLKVVLRIASEVTRSHLAHRCSTR